MKLTALDWVVIAAVVVVVVLLASRLFGMSDAIDSDE